MNKFLIISSVLVSMTFVGHAQVGIGIKNPSESSVLHVVDPDAAKGMLIPNVALVDVNVFYPVQGNPHDPTNIGLLVYNTNNNELNGLYNLFYYWAGYRWHAILNEDMVESILERRRVTPPQDELVGFEKVIYDPDQKQFYTIIVDEQGDVVQKDLIDFKFLVQRDETKTQLAKKEHIDELNSAEYFLSTQEPSSEKARIVYKYQPEDSNDTKNYYIDITQDILSSIQNNDKLRDELNYILDSGQTAQASNVYFGELPEFEGERLYRSVPGINGEPVITLITLSDDILRFFKENTEIIHREILNALGYNITNKGVSTGNKHNGSIIYVFKQGIQIYSDNAQVHLTLPTQIKNTIDQVESISLLDPQGNSIKIGTTDVLVGSEQIEFALGSGGMYTTLPEGNYTAIVRFLKK
ncbi:hypothetical protein [Myroides sp. LJL119]